MGRRINLVPQSERSRTTTDFGMLALLAVVVLVIFGIGLSYYVLNGRLDTKQQELADVEQQVAQLQSQVAALDQYAQLSTQRQRVEGTVQQIYAGRTLVAGIMDDISLVVPEDAWFDTLDLTTADPVAPATGQPSVGPADNRLSLEGNTYSFEGVAQVLVRLRLIPTLTDVALVSAGDPIGEVDPEVDVKGFTAEATVVNDQGPETPLPVGQAEVVAP